MSDSERVGSFQWICWTKPSLNDSFNMELNDSLTNRTESVRLNHTENMLLSDSQWACLECTEYLTDAATQVYFNLIKQINKCYDVGNWIVPIDMILTQCSLLPTPWKSFTFSSLRNINSWICAAPLPAGRAVARGLGAPWKNIDVPPPPPPHTHTHTHISYTVQYTSMEPNCMLFCGLHNISVIQLITY